MFRLRRPRCPCGGRLQKVEFYLDPYQRWDHYYCCNSCGVHGSTAEDCLAASKQQTSGAYNTTAPEPPWNRILYTKE